MNKNGPLRFLEDCGLGVLSSIGPDGGPQSALVGIAVTPELEIVFDTVAASRKFANIGHDTRVAFVMGWQGEITVQYEGIARQISSTEIGPYHETYFSKISRRPRADEEGGDHLLCGRAEVDSIQRLQHVTAGDRRAHIPQTRLCNCRHFE